MLHKAITTTNDLQKGGLTRKQQQQLHIYKKKFIKINYKANVRQQKNAHFFVYKKN